MRSLRGLIICEDPDLCTRLEELLLETGEVEPTLVLQHYPERFEAARHLNLCRPDMALLAIDRLQDTLAFLKELESSAPTIPIIGISRLQDPRALAELMRLGMRDCIAAPLNRTRFHEAIHRVTYQYKEGMNGRLVERLVSFLPARGGSGTSTLACNLSHVMSSLPGAQVLLTDFDAASGLSRFLFKLTPAGSLGELLAGGCALEGESWNECVVTAGQLHIIHGGPVRSRGPFTPDQTRQLIDFVSPRYNVICADLSGGMETYTMQLLRRSRRILLVCSTEAESIEMAHEKLQLLDTMQLLPRTGVLLTQFPDQPTPNVPQVQAYLGAPVEAVFNFAGKGVLKCLAEGSLMDAQSGLGRQMDQFARGLVSQLAN